MSTKIWSAFHVYRRPRLVKNKNTNFLDTTCCVFCHGTFSDPENFDRHIGRTHNSNRFHYVQSRAHSLTQNWPESKEGLSVAHANIHTELNASADYRLRDPHRNFSRGETDPVFGPEANSRRPRKTAMSYKLKVFTVDITCDKCGTILIASFDKEVIPFEDGRNAFDLHRCITIP